ncbi:S8 family peptidase [Deinococcus misasensis]|uniref:S8 family peptidase n=1 Tax=Deinococcus misasensis TaxID=392413 RepID=UPI00069120CE|nr:S8 family serine peptidase [Deinococcus misasensis]
MRWMWIPFLLVGCASLNAPEQTAEQVVSQNGGTFVLVGTDATSNPYLGDTPVSQSLPVLCINKSNLPNPGAAMIGTSYTTPGGAYRRTWSGGTIALTPPIKGQLLTSRAFADGICAQNFGAGYRMASFHDGDSAVNAGWDFWAATSQLSRLQTQRFWVAINTTSANPWNNPTQPTRKALTWRVLAPTLAPLGAQLQGSSWQPGQNLTVLINRQGQNVDDQTLQGLQVLLDGQPVPFVTRASALTVTLPWTLAVGTHELRVTEPQGSIPLSFQVTALSPSQWSATDTSYEVLAVVLRGVQESTLQSKINQLNQSLSTNVQYVAGSLKPLSATVHPLQSCNTSVATLRIPKTAPLGSVLARLDAEKDTFSGINPISVDYMDAGVYTAEPISPALLRSTLGLDAVQNAGWTGTGTTIAVLDTGVAGHTELSGRLISRGNYSDFPSDTIGSDHFDDRQALYNTSGSNMMLGHGTPVAVLAAGKTLGVAPQAQLERVRVCDVNGRCQLNAVVQGLCATLSKPQSDLRKLVLNLSFGGSTPSVIMENLLSEALSSNVLVVTSAGNSQRLQYPAAYGLPGLVVVGAAEKKGSLWQTTGFSNTQVVIDVLAPGAGLTSGSGVRSVNGYIDTYSNFQGTSFAAPLVSGTLALLRQKWPNATPQELERLLQTRQTPVAASVVGMLNLPDVLR